MQETWVRSLGWKDSLEKGTATHSIIMAWRIPWTEESGRLQSMGYKESDMTERLSLSEHLDIYQVPADPGAQAQGPGAETGPVLVPKEFTVQLGDRQSVEGDGGREDAEISEKPLYRWVLRADLPEGVTFRLRLG